jgi:hypothetical protein
VGWHVACMVDIRNISFKHSDDKDQIHLAQDRYQWQVILNMIMNF